MQHQHQHPPQQQQRQLSQPYQQQQQQQLPQYQQQLYAPQDQQQFYTHTQQTHGMAAPGEPVMRCHWIHCNASFSSDKALMKHLGDHADASDPVEGGKFQCLWDGGAEGLCNKLETKKSNLKSHVNVHHNYLGFVCWVCFQEMKRRTDLTAHVKRRNHQITQELVQSWDVEKVVQCLQKQPIDTDDEHALNNFRARNVDGERFVELGQPSNLSALKELCGSNLNLTKRILEFLSDIRSCSSASTQSAPEGPLRDVISSFAKKRLLSVERDLGGNMMQELGLEELLGSHLYFRHQAKQRKCEFKDLPSQVVAALESNNNATQQQQPDDYLFHYMEQLIEDPATVSYSNPNQAADMFFEENDFETDPDANSRHGSTPDMGQFELEDILDLFPEVTGATPAPGVFSGVGLDDLDLGIEIAPIKQEPSDNVEPVENAPDTADDIPRRRVSGQGFKYYVDKYLATRTFAEFPVRTFAELVVRYQRMRAFDTMAKRIEDELARRASGYFHL